MKYERVSPGVYRNSKTGELQNSVSNPSKIGNAVAAGKMQQMPQAQAMPRMPMQGPMPGQMVNQPGQVPPGFDPSRLGEMYGADGGQDFQGLTAKNVYDGVNMMGKQPGFTGRGEPLPNPFGIPRFQEPNAGAMRPPYGVKPPQQYGRNFGATNSPNAGAIRPAVVPNRNRKGR